jgi:hypothetical protein
MECNSNRKGQRKFHFTHLGTTGQSTTGIQKFTKEIRSIRSFLDEKPVKNCHVLTEEKLEKIRNTLEYSPQQSPRCLAQEK